MKNIRVMVKQLLIISTLILPWTAAEALEAFREIGTITKIGYDQFEIQNRTYRLAPGAQLKSNDTSRRKFSDFKEGDEIRFNGKVLNGINYVDIISYRTPEPS